MPAETLIAQIGLYLLYILLPLLALYIGYLIITKAFHDMGFSSIEAIIIVFVSFLLGSGIVDGYAGITFSNIHLFDSGKWQVGINIGGAVIPLLLSIYLIIKNKIPLRRVALGIVVVAVITFFVTRPDPQKGIISSFPFWLFPAVAASIVSLFLLWKIKKKAAPLAYISGVVGVLIGADVFHLFTLLQNELTTSRNAIIGGAHVFDMVFITGILAVILDGILTFGQKKEKQNTP